MPIIISVISASFSRELLEGTELFRSGFDGSQDHDMIPRLTSNAKCIVHVPKLMYYWRSHKGSVASDISAKPYAIAAAKGAVADHPDSLWLLRILRLRAPGHLKRYLRSNMRY